ncbi:hypothetical protein GN244_ATG15005 [Phytophthora infestans]|uniref:Uncharacterized protein n=1 Tax=Phytophthora infestans TaxID=4787 RepID=A0A833SWK5_PHYIN|nr:hypothetical protein GN244_ATG15005 [Phytophthora infestans]
MRTSRRRKAVATKTVAGSGKKKVEKRKKTVDEEWEPDGEEDFDEDDDDAEFEEAEWDLGASDSASEEAESSNAARTAQKNSIRWRKRRQHQKGQLPSAKQKKTRVTIPHDTVVVTSTDILSLEQSRASEVTGARAAPLAVLDAAATTTDERCTHIQHDADVVCSDEKDVDGLDSDCDEDADELIARRYI